MASVDERWALAVQYNDELRDEVDDDVAALLILQMLCFCRQHSRNPTIVYTAQVSQQRGGDGGGDNQV